MRKDLGAEIEVERIGGEKGGCVGVDERRRRRSPLSSSC